MLSISPWTKSRCPLRLAASSALVGTWMSNRIASAARLAGVPAVQWSLGAGDPAKLKELAAAGQQPPSLHSSLFAPDRDPTIATGVEAEVAVLMDLLGKP